MANGYCRVWLTGRVVYSHRIPRAGVMLRSAMLEFEPDHTGAILCFFFHEREGYVYPERGDYIAVFGQLKMRVERDSLGNLGRANLLALVVKDWTIIAKAGEECWLQRLISKKPRGGDGSSLPRGER